jgi:hypothetical protein
LVEAEQLEPAQALLLGALGGGATPEQIRPWFTDVVSDHLISYGHGAIYAQKAFQLLERLGWERANTVLPYLLPTIVYGTREDKLPYMKLFHEPGATGLRRAPRRRNARPWGRRCCSRRCSAGPHRGGVGGGAGTGRGSTACSTR